MHQITLLVVCFLDANVKKQLQRVEERLSKDFEKEKALYKGMFNKQKQAEEDAVEKNPNQVWELGRSAPAEKMKNETEEKGLTKMWATRCPGHGI